MTKLDEETIQTLKLCLDGSRSNCMRCSLGNGGKAILTCRELLEKLAEFAGVEIERSNNDDNLHV